MLQKIVDLVIGKEPMECTCRVPTIGGPMVPMGTRKTSLGAAEIFSCRGWSNGHCYAIAARIRHAGRYSISRFERRSFKVGDFSMSEEERLGLLMDAVALETEKRTLQSIEEAKQHRRERAQLDVRREVALEILPELRRKISGIEDATMREEILDDLARVLTSSSAHEAWGERALAVEVDQIPSLKRVAVIDPRCRKVCEEFLGIAVGVARLVAKAAVAKRADDLGLGGGMLSALKAKAGTKV